MANSDKDIKITPNTGSANLPKIEFTGADNATKTMSIADSGAISFDGDLTVTGNFTVSGTSTSVDTETVTIDDNIIVLNNNETGTPSENAGIEVERGTSANALIRWNETTDRWEFTNNGTNYYNIPLSTEYTNNNAATTFTLTGDSGTNQTIAHGNTLDIAGGTGIDTVVGATDTVTVAIDSTVATLTGSQTLTNKSLTSPSITGTTSTTGDLDISSLYGRLNFKKDSNGNVNNDAIYFINGSDQYAGGIKYFHSTNQLRFQANQADQLYIQDGAIYPPVDNDVDLGTSSLKFKDSFFGLVDAENFKINGGQGSDGQVLTSTGSGVAWENAAGGGDSWGDTVDAHIIPDTDNAYDLGSSTAEFRNGYFDGTLYADDLMMGGNITAANTSMRITAGGSQESRAHILLPNNETYMRIYGSSTSNTDIILDTRYTSGTGEIQFKTKGSTRFAVGADGEFLIGTSESSGSSGQVLTSGGSGAAPSWTSVSGGASDLDGLSDAKKGGTNFSNSIILGHQTTGTLSSANHNTAIGDTSMNAITSGAYNVFVGSKAGSGLTSGSSNVGIGYTALNATITGDKNIGIGEYSGALLTDGDHNIFMGRSAGYSNTTGNRNIAIGNQAYDAADTESDNIAIGYDALGGSIAGGEENLAIGNYAGDAITSGDGNVVLGHRAGSGITTGAKNTYLGWEAGETTSTAWENVGIGDLALNANTTGGGNVAVGHQALRYTTTGYVNVGVGQDAGMAITTGQRNTGVGGNSLRAVTEGHYNIGLGQYAGDNITTGTGNVVIGRADVPSATGNRQLSISAGDIDSVVWITGDSSGHVSLGNFEFDTDQTVGSGQDNYVLTYDHSDGQISLEAAGGGGASAIGSLDDVLMDATNFTNGFLLQLNSDGSAPTTGTLNGATGNIGLGEDVLANLTSADYNIAIGNQSLNDVTTGGYNIAIGGWGALQKITTQSNNIGIGSGAGENITNGAGNICIGGNASKGNSGGVASSYNVAIGHDVMYAINGVANNNVAIGKYAMRDGLTTGDDNVAIGESAGRNISTASNLVFIGKEAGHNNTTGLRNIAIGYKAYDNADTESDNIAIGYDALGGSVAGGEYNVAIGNYSLDALTTADYNVVIGHNAGTLIQDGGSNVVIGAEAAGNGDIGASNVLVGMQSGYSSTDATQSVAIGNDAGKFGLKSATGSIAMGQNALKGHSSNTTGANYNTALGHYSMEDVTTGDDNTAVGSYSLKEITTGSTNIAIGHDAGNNITTGSNNVVIGAADVTATGSDQLSISSGDGSPVWITGNSSGVVDFPNGLTSGGSAVGGGASALNDLSDAITTEYDNIGIGTNALDSITAQTGNNNVAIGKSSGTDVTVGSNNTFVGHQSGTNIVNGSDGVAIGYRTGYSTGSSDVSQYVVIGSQSGKSVHETYQTSIGAYSGWSGAIGATLIGHESGKYIASGDNTIAIGRSACVGGSSTPTSGHNNIAIGYAAQTAGFGTGANNVVIGGSTSVTADSDSQLKIASGNGGVTWITGNSDGGVAIGGIEQRGATVSATSTADAGYITLLEVPYADYKAIKASVHITDSTNNEVQTMDVMAHYDGSAANYTSYGIIFDGAAAIGSIEADLNGSNLRLRFKNEQGGTATLAGSIHAVLHA